MEFRPEKAFGFTKEVVKELRKRPIDGPTDILIEVLSLPPTLIVDIASLPFAVSGLINPPYKTR